MRVKSLVAPFTMPPTPKWDRFELFELRDRLPTITCTLGLATVPYTVTAVLDTAVQEYGRGITAREQ
jgi:hypothetical protein